ncbi:cell division protein FtsA [Clostridium thermarum]|uniref:cell division protein FtsA n=1 Tax=Clostridium thermarum TaxID=1716543 RepID=UPI0013D14A17|nr:cell division protein FtsA [Clostridium thermarum]
MNDLLVAFDIGYSKISAAVARVDGFKQMNVVAVSSVNNYGIKKSVVVDVEQVVEAIAQCKAKLENLVDSSINDAYISIHGGLCSIQDAKETVSIVSGSTITDKDVEKIMNITREKASKPEREVVWLLPVQYSVDQYSGIEDPIGIRGKELTFEAKLFTVDSMVVKDLVKCMETAGIKVRGIIPEPIALGKLVTTEEHKVSSIGIVNVGAESTDLSIYEMGRICYTKYIPLGGNSITKDIMSCLSIPYADAEKVKLKYTQNTVNGDNQIDEKFKDDIQSMYNSGIINEVIEARVEELITFALKEINNKKRLKEFDRIFITGGGIIYYKDIIAKFEEELGKPIQIIENNMMGAGNWIYSVPVGMLKVILDSIKIVRNEASVPSEGNGKKSKKSIFGRLKNLIDEFI